MDHTLAQLTTNEKFKNPKPFTPANRPSLAGANFSLGITLKERGIDLTKYPDAPFPQRKDLCFYHQAFGNKAFKCNVGCAWVNRTGKQIEQVPIRQLKPNVASPPRSSTGATGPSSNHTKNA